MSKTLEKRVRNLETNKGIDTHFVVEDRASGEFWIDGESMTEEQFRKRIEAFPENSVRKIIICENSQRICV